LIADDVADRRSGAAGVVQVGEPVGEAGAKVQQGCGQPPGHPGITVGSARDLALEQAEHSAHALHFVESIDEMHFRRAGVDETDLNA
jgi:hypothetical protein